MSDLSFESKLAIRSTIRFLISVTEGMKELEYLTFLGTLADDLGMIRGNDRRMLNQLLQDWQTNVHKHSHAPPLLVSEDERLRRIARDCRNVGKNP